MRVAYARRATPIPQAIRRLCAPTTPAIRRPRLTRPIRAFLPTSTAPGQLVMPATRMVAVRMKRVWSPAFFISTLLLGTVVAATQADLRAQTQAVNGTAPAPVPAKNIFHVKYVSEGAVYLDAGHNSGLEEGMVLHLIHA